MNLEFSDDLEPREKVLADPQRVGQILRNLLSNAAKYSPEGTPMELRHAPKGRGEAHAHRGRGPRPGLHPDCMVRIFEKFGRGRDARGTKVAGAGLGLCLSRRIMQAHGSGLTVDSKLGEGSVLGFELKLA